MNPVQKLEKQELIDFVRDNQHLTQDELIEQCGYVMTRQGKRSLKKTEFWTAYSVAQGLPVGPPPLEKKSPSRPENRLKITSKGTLPVGGPWTRALGLGEGDYVRAEISHGSLIITPWPTEPTEMEVKETCSFTPVNCSIAS